MFFIFGTPRSGTTLLAQCLSGNTEIVVPNETDFIVPTAFVLDRIHDADTGRQLIAEIITNSPLTRASLGEYISEDTIRGIVRSSPYDLGSLLNAIYQAIAKASGVKLAGDKSPNDLLFLRMVIKVGGITPDTKILHIVRDIRDVMVSLKRVGWVADLDLYFPRFWSNSNLYLFSLFKNDASRYKLVRYEELVSKPEAVLDGICRFMGVEFQPEMLDPQNRHPRYAGAPHHQRLYQPITAETVGGYRRALDPGTMSSYEDQAREALAAFGYASTAHHRRSGQP